MIQLSLPGTEVSNFLESPATSSVRPWRAVLQTEIENLRRECDRLRSTVDGVDLRIESDYIYYDESLRPSTVTNTERLNAWAETEKGKGLTDVKFFPSNSTGNDLEVVASDALALLQGTDQRTDLSKDIL